MIKINSPGVFDSALIDYDNTTSDLNSSQVQNAIDEIVGTNGSAVCNTAGNVAEKTVTIANYSLRVGAKAVITFTNKNTAQSPTLNISNTGAKALKANGNDATDVISEGSVFIVNYNGTSYDLVGGVGTNTISKYLEDPGDFELDLINYTAERELEDATIETALVTVENAPRNFTHTITENIIMNSGNYDYVKTTVIQEVNDVMNGSTTITRVAKE